MIYEGKSVIIPYANVVHAEPTSDDCLIVVTSISKRPSGQMMWDNAVFIRAPEVADFLAGWMAFLADNGKG